MKKLQTITVACLLSLGFSFSAYSQCNTWNDSPRKEEAENSHVIYRQYVKDKKPEDIAAYDEETFNTTYNNWKKAYEIAPAADGQRPFHFTDGRKIHKALIKKASDEEKKKEYMETVIRLYDEQAECFPKEAAFLQGRKAFDMFYSPQYGYRQATMDALAKAIEMGGKKSEYILLEPYGQILVYMFNQGKVEKEKARAIVDELTEIANHNIENNSRYGAYYESAKARMDSHIKKIENDIFDCAYFRDKLMPQVEENPDDLEILKYAFNKLRVQGCDTTEQFMIDLKAQYQKKAAELNAKLEAEFLAKNPGVAAKRAYDDGDYKKAIELYEEAIEKAKEEDDQQRQAEYWFGIASIQFRKLNQYSTARSSARKAASLNKDWGRPYMLIGDMYAQTSSSCGKDGYSRGLAVLAAIDKYSYARSIDSEVADEANKKIGIYSASIPSKDDVFMRGKQGATERVGCWIGEKVKVRFN